jgi:hypothetical protein
LLGIVEGEGDLAPTVEDSPWSAFVTAILVNPGPSYGRFFGQLAELFTEKRQFRLERRTCFTGNVTKISFLADAFHPVGSRECLRGREIAHRALQGVRCSPQPSRITPTDCVLDFD